MFSAPLHIGIYHFTEDKQEFSSGLEFDVGDVDLARHEFW